MIINAEKMREKSLLYREKINAKVIKNNRKIKREIIKQIENDIKVAARTGEQYTVSVFRTSDLRDIKKYIVNYFSTKGYKVKIYTYFDSFINISWEEKEKINE